VHNRAQNVEYPMDRDVRTGPAFMRSTAQYAEYSEAYETCLEYSNDFEMPAHTLVTYNTSQYVEYSDDCGIQTPGA
jgi:hypothetical protein